MMLGGEEAHLAVRGGSTSKATPWRDSGSLSGLCACVCVCVRASRSAAASSTCFCAFLNACADRPASFDAAAWPSFEISLFRAWLVPTAVFPRGVWGAATRRARCAGLFRLRAANLGSRRCQQQILY